MLNATELAIMMHLIKKYIGNTPQLVDGVLPLTVIPPAAIEKMKSVANDTARFKLTKQDVQNGDTVYVEATNKMYLVIDDTKLNLEAGYKVYMAGRATEAYADEDGNRIKNTYATYWSGTKEQYNSLSEADKNKYVLYLIKSEVTS